MRSALQAIGGLAFGVLLVVGFEGLLALFGVGDDAPRYDPFAGFSSAVPTFEVAREEAGPPHYRLAASRDQNRRLEDLAEPQREFLAEKPPGGFRAFVIGGSSSEGIPYSTSYSFAAWLEQRLAAALPEVPIEVVNAGFSGYASRRLLPVVEEIAGYEPDLLVIYMGHNEWAERMYYEHLLKLDPRLFRILEWGYGTRTYALASRILDLEAFAAPPPLEMDPRENTFQMFGVFKNRAQGGDTPSARELAYRDLLYENNLRAMIDAMRRVGAEVVLCTLSQNFSDWPPPASRHREDLDEETRATWQRHFDRGVRLSDAGDCRGALVAYERALEIDDRHADLHFRMARCLRAFGRLDDARRHFRLASDLDAVPHGASTHINDIVRRVAADEGVLLVDVDALLQELSGPDLVGYDLFTDFAHPNLRANQVIARAIGDALRDAGIPRPAAAWRDGWEPPTPESLHREEPRLRVLELESRVFVCLLAPRETCHAEATELLAADPGNAVATRVLQE